MMIDLSAQEIRTILKTRAILLRCGFLPKHNAVLTLSLMRDAYALEVGLPVYLSQMLGPVANVPLSQCMLYSADGQPVEVKCSELPVQRFIAQRYTVETMPWVVEYYELGSDVVTRYL